MNDASEEHKKHEEQQKHEEMGILDKIELLKNRPMGRFSEYTQNNTKEVIAYALLTLGILLLFPFPIVGQMAVGAVAGSFFSEELMRFIAYGKQFVIDLGTTRSIVAGGLFLGLFLEAPFIFVGIALSAALKNLIFPTSEGKE